MMPAEPDNHREPVQDFSQRPNRQADADWNPYESNWSESRPILIQSQTVSALSILSMISGIVSIPFICLCFFSLPFSLFAIVSGHISRSICRRSQGRVTGDGMAVAGLSLGYVSLSIIVAMFIFMFSVRSSGPGGFSGPATPRFAPQWTNGSDAEEELNFAIECVSTSGGEGNSEIAKNLAKHLQDALRDIAQQLRTDDAQTGEIQADANQLNGIDQATQSPTVLAELPDTIGSTALQQGLQSSTVYCALNDDSCAFLVAIENVSGLTASDRLTLSQMIWLAAGNSVDDHLDEGERFAVALVQDEALVEISVGIYERSNQYDAGLTDRVPGDNIEYRLQLKTFFEPQQLSPEEEAPVIEESDELIHEMPGK